MTRLALILAIAAACGKDNPYFCDDACQAMLDAPPGGAGACASNAECSEGTPVCDTTQSVCVACTATEIGACGGNKPVCAANTCAPCVAHDECASDACLPMTGACGTDADVAYVASTGNDANPCTHDLPCATLTYAAGRSKPFVKLANNLDEVVLLANTNVTVLAEPGTLIRRTASNGPIITVSGTSNVTLHDVVIREGATSIGHGITVASGDNAVVLTLDGVAILNNTGYGLSIGGGTLNMSRCLIANNFAGGATITGDFEITNSMFVANGTNSSITGGLSLTPGSTKKLFNFNTVAGNDSSNTVGRGINCTFPMTVTSTIVAGNLPNGCSFDYSMFDTAVSVNGSNNTVGDPVFKNTNATAPLAPDFYRIANNSDAIDGAAPSSSVMTDIDGDARPQGGIRDVGADEYK